MRKAGKDLAFDIDAGVRELAAERLAFRAQHVDLGHVQEDGRQPAEVGAQRRRQRVRLVGGGEDVGIPERIGTISW